jgi:hypothetical protein
LSSNGELFIGTNSLSYEPSSAGTVTVAGVDQLTAIYIKPQASSTTFNLNGSLSAGEFYLAAATGTTGSSFNTNNYPVYLGTGGTGYIYFDSLGENVFNAGSSTIENGCVVGQSGSSNTLNLDSSTVSCNGDYDLSYVTQNPGTSTVSSMLPEIRIYHKQSVFQQCYPKQHRFVAGVNDEVIVFGNLDIDNNLSITDGSLDLNTNDPITTIGNNATIASGTNLFASDSSLLSVGGSFTNSGTFTANLGTITFNSSSSGKTITSNSATNKFYNVVFNGSGGEWTLQDIFTN